MAERAGVNDARLTDPKCLFCEPIGIASWSRERQVSLFFVWHHVAIIFLS